jgi:hypothetical protein
MQSWPMLTILLSTEETEVHCKEENLPQVNPAEFISTTLPLHHPIPFN